MVSVIHLWTQSYIFSKDVAYYYFENILLFILMIQLLVSVGHFQALNDGTQMRNVKCPTKMYYYSQVSLTTTQGKIL